MKLIEGERALFERLREVETKQKRTWIQFYVSFNDVLKEQGINVRRYRASRREGAKS